MVETYGGCPLINLEDQSRGRADHATAQNMVSVHRFNSGVLDAGRGGTSSRRLELPIDNDRIDSVGELLENVAWLVLTFAEVIPATVVETRGWRAWRTQNPQRRVLADVNDNGRTQKF